MKISELKPGQKFVDSDRVRCVCAGVLEEAVFGYWCNRNNGKWSGLASWWGNEEDTEVINGWGSLRGCRQPEARPHYAAALMRVFAKGEGTNMKVKEIRPDSAPVRMTPGAAGYDLINAGALVELQEGDTVHVDTGFAVALPPGHVGMIRARSGASFKHGITVLGITVGDRACDGTMILAGVIDEDYRGEVRVALHRVVTRKLLYRITDKLVRWIWLRVSKIFDAEFISVADTVKTDAFEIANGERVAQLLVLPCHQEPVEIVKELDETERGGDGFGSTGK